MKILWFSQGPDVGSGTGVQTDLMTRTLAERGHELLIIDSESRSRIRPLSDGRLVTGGSGQRGDVTADIWTDDFNPDVAVILEEPDLLTPEVWQRVSNKTPLVVWPMVNAEPYRRDFYAQVPAAIPLAMTAAGKQLMTEAGLHPIGPVGHGVDLGVFRRSEDPKLRDVLSRGRGEHAFLVGVVASNVSGLMWKGWPTIFEAFAQLGSVLPDARLYLHTNVTRSHGGVNLRLLAQICGIDEDTVMWCAPNADHIATRRQLAGIYSQLDVLLAPSMAESFNTVLIEAQACGTPVVATPTVSANETVKVGRVIAGGIDVWHEPMCCWYRLADPTETADHLLELAARTDYQIADDRLAAANFAQRFDHREIGALLEQHLLEVAGL